MITIISKHFLALFGEYSIIRLFIALDFPADVKTYLAMLAIPIPGVRWVPSENLHLTLYFIGNVDEEIIKQIDTNLRHLSMPKFSLRVQGVNLFVTKKKVRSLWAGIDHNDALIQLHTQIVETVLPIRHVSNKRPFRPHVTLARCKSVSILHIEPFLQKYRLFHIDPVPIETFTLFESILDMPTVRYRPLCQYSLLGLQ